MVFKRDVAAFMVIVSTLRLWSSGQSAYPAKYKLAQTWCLEVKNVRYQHPLVGMLNVQYSQPSHLYEPIDLVFEAAFARKLVLGDVPRLKGEQAGQHSTTQHSIATCELLALNMFVELSR